MIYKTNITGVAVQIQFIKFKRVSILVLTLYKLINIQNNFYLHIPERKPN